MNTPAISVQKSDAISGAKSGVHREVPARVRDRREGAGQRPSTPATRKSRLLKGASALQSRPRRPAGELRYSLVPLLTDRDREIVAAVARFKVFTAEQVAEMFFDTRKRAQVRLRRLHELGVLDRFQPYRHRWGSSPFHYVLGPVGAEMAAADAEEDNRRPVKRPSATGLALGRPRDLALGRPRDLARLRAVNGFYASLVGHARRHPQARLLDWMTAEEAARWSDGIVEPDAFGEWVEGDRTVEFFLVVDRGGPVEALVADLSRYERFEDERGQHAALVLLVRSRQRATFVLRCQAKIVGHSRYSVVDSAGPLIEVLAREGACTSATPGPRSWLFERRRRVRA